MNRDGQYVELARFRLGPGVSDEQFLQAEDAVREGMLKTFPGYVSRELYRSEAGEWTVILRFRDRTTMEALLARLASDPDEPFRRFGSMIDRATMRVDFVWFQK